VSEAVPTFPPRLDTGENDLTLLRDLGPTDPAAPVVDIPASESAAAAAARQLHAVQPGLGPRPTEAPAGVEISYEQFGRYWIRHVLHLERITSTVDALLGPTIELGPIGAGPGRAFASVTVFGRFGKTSGREIQADLLTYEINLPIAITFTLDLPVDSLTFNADVVIPLRLVVHTEAPTVVRMELSMPPVDQVEMQISPSTRRGAVFQKITGLESELRRFLPVVLETELAKPYIQRAMRLDMEELIDNSWGNLSQQFLPQSPEDRKS
jgi:hypothetical protein